MKNIQVYRHSSSLWQKFLNLNPQLFREIKGKLKTKNVIIAAAISVITQFVVGISLLSNLPTLDPQGLLGVQSGRYGMGVGYRAAYTKDMFGDWIINWQLLWLDLFMTLSIIAIFSLLIIGTYMLIADTAKEESRGTLNFIRLTPQSATTILLGKILGVPILLYIAVLLMLPLQVVAGLGAHVPLVLIIGFNAVILASCAFYYSFALVWSSLDLGLSGLKPWLGAGVVGFLLTILTNVTMHDNHVINHAIWDWIVLFNPGIVLAYLIDATYLSLNKIDFLSAQNFGELLFYGQALWTKASFGIAFILFNFSLWTYWCWSVLTRRFHNPHNTLLSKSQSYWITGWLSVFALGFTLQDSSTYLWQADGFVFLQFCLCTLGLILIAALSPHRQKLYDWARYRHQVHHNGNVLWKELIFGENSPSGVAVAINMAIAITYITPSIFLFLQHNRQYIFWGFVLSGFSVLLYGLVAQLILTLKTHRRGIWSAIGVISMIIVPPVCLSFANVYPSSTPQPWLWGFLPTAATEYATISTILLAILGQVVAISAIAWQTTKVLKQAGKSETKTLLETSKISS